ncbi:transposase family protein [Streptomyces massasporeus]|uniref:helix-turn-helix domain-containing protein n=1 Tax=Streptomyces massasporeus TaxID=67324 RepID=UPI003693334A
MSAAVIAELVAEVGPLWHERHQARLASRPRKRAVGAGAKHQMVFVDRLLATLVHLRHAATHDVLACWFGVDRSTITWAIGEVRPLLAERGCTISAGVRLRTLAEVIDHIGASEKTGTSTAPRSESGARLPDVKTGTSSSPARASRTRSRPWSSRMGDGRMLFCSPTRHGSCADVTHARQLGLVRLLEAGPTAEILADAGDQGLVLQRSLP